ncbi:hypothetical protein [uncultured Dubosiella sp.]|uniref:hypothetical protein n=1 Tax=uncultured Dubosiella sp. TaxID=1937011 RepID=UPI00258C8E6B|nr:hypothetical protein [uncultured Dubosiella sp.]
MDNKVKIKVYSLSGKLLEEIYVEKSIGLKDLRDTVVKDGANIIDYNRNWIINYSADGSYEVVVYKHINGKIQWNVPISYLTLEDYLEEFPIDEIALIRVPYGVGGISFPGIEWELICSIFQNIYDFGTVACTIYGLYEISQDKELISKIINKIRNIFLNEKNGIVEIKTVIQFITSKKHWALKDFEFQMSLEEDEELAKFLLEFAGYLYSEKYDLYFFNEECAQKGKAELQELVNNYLQTYSINCGVKYKKEIE